MVSSTGPGSTGFSFLVGQTSNRMSEVGDDIETLRSQIAQLESQLGDLKRRLSAVVNTVNALSKPSQLTEVAKGWKWPLEAEEYKRYGRQMIMPEVGLQGEPRHVMCNGIRLIDLRARTAQSKEGISANCWRGRTWLSSCSIPCWCWSRHSWSR